MIGNDRVIRFDLELAKLRMKRARSKMTDGIKERANQTRRHLLSFANSQRQRVVGKATDIGIKATEHTLIRLKGLREALLK